MTLTILTSNDWYKKGETYTVSPDWPHTDTHWAVILPSGENEEFDAVGLIAKEDAEIKEE